MSNQPVKLNLKLNLHHSPPDRRDYKIKIKAPKPLKFNNVDLSNFCTSVKDQGAVGSCTAFAVIGLMEYIHKRALNNGDEDVYSEKFTYYDTRVNQLGWPASEDTGAYLRNAMASVVQQGAAPEEAFPYNNFFAEIPPTSVFDAAQSNQVVSYANLPDGQNEAERATVLESCKQLLQEGYPIVGGFVCYDSLWSAQNGVLAPPGGTVIGGHAILIVGFDEGKKLFKFKNSWSNLWGDQGYGYLPYEYLLKGDLWDMWTVFSQENFSDDDVIDIEKPASDEGTKQNKDDLIKSWSVIVKDIQNLGESVENCAGLQTEITNCINDVSVMSNQIKTLNARVLMMSRQLTSYKQQLNDKVDDLQKKVIDCYDQISA